MHDVHITMAVHWEGRHLDGVEPLAEARRRLLPGVPMTHFVSAAYFARGGDIEAIVRAMLPAFESGDEVALHVPAWQSLRGASSGPARTVIAGDDPELVVEYPGITAQTDRGYTLPISGYDKAAIESFIVTSKLLLRPLLQTLIVQRKIQIERVLRGIRAGHGMASDGFLASACNAGFAYDASAMDGIWARSAADDAAADERNQELFAPLWRDWSRLWGAVEQTEPHLSNRGMLASTSGAGVNAGTQPFFIARCGSSRLLELPLGGGVIPPVRPQHVAELLATALDSPPGLSRVISIAIRQETAQGCLDALLGAEVLRSKELRWTTNADLLTRLLGEPGVPAPSRESPLQAIRQQLRQPPPTASAAPPGVPTVVVPPIQMPPINT